MHHDTLCEDEPMKVTGVTPILNVSSVAASVQWFASLGWTCGFAWNGGGAIESGALTNAHGEATFASVCAGEGQVFLCRDGQGLRGGKPARFDGDDDTGATWMSVWLGSPAEVDEAHRKLWTARSRYCGHPRTNHGALGNVDSCTQTGMSFGSRRNVRSWPCLAAVAIVSLQELSLREAAA